MAALVPQFATSPALLVHKIDAVRQLALLTVMDEGDYRRASFLDDRILGPDAKSVWTPLAQVITRLTAPGAPHFIFHQGHTGSTLLSRLLDDMGAFGLREPMVLQNLAELNDRIGEADSLYDAAGFEALARALLHALARRFEAGSVPVVKATSHAGRVGATLLRIAPSSRAVTLSMQPEPYLAVLLAGANTPEDLRGFAQERMRRIVARFGAVSAPLYQLRLGELGAMAWLAERAAQKACPPAQTLELDFDGFLAEPATQLERVAAHLGLDTARADAAIAGPAMRSYSKAPEHAYSPDVRRDLMNEARARLGAEIKAGLEWLERAGAQSEAAARVIAG